MKRWQWVRYRVHAQGKVGGSHHWRMSLGWIVCIRHGLLSFRVGWMPLPCPGRTLLKIPFISEQGIEIAVVHLMGSGSMRLLCRWRWCRHLCRCRICFPAQSLLFNRCSFGSGPTLAASPAPWHLPKVCPPATRATVSSSFMAMRANVSRTSLPEATALGSPLEPSGFT